MSNEALPLPIRPGQDVEDTKSDLREIVRKTRSSRPKSERKQAGEALARHALQVAGDSACVASYVAVPGEPDTRQLHEALTERGVRILLPKLGPALTREWGLYQGEEDLEVRAPGRPPEPSMVVPEAEAICQADVIFTPALLVDDQGNRLGQGAGWYDRVLRQAKPSARFYALVFSEELIEDELPTDEHDVPVHGAVSPSGLVEFPA